MNRSFTLCWTNFKAPVLSYIRSREVIIVTWKQRWCTYPDNVIFFKIILSGSTLRREPEATMLVSSGWFASLKTISGRGGKQIGANIEATAKRPGWRNRSNLCLSMLRSSVEKIGLQATTDPHCMSITTRAPIHYSLSNITNKVTLSHELYTSS